MYLNGYSAIMAILSHCALLFPLPLPLFHYRVTEHTTDSGVKFTRYQNIIDGSSETYGTVNHHDPFTTRNIRKCIAQATIDEEL